MVFRPTRLHTPNGISVLSAVFVGPTVVTNTWTHIQYIPGMLRPGGPCGLEAKLLGLGISLGLTLSGLDASISASWHLTSATVRMTLINIHNIATDNHFCCVWVAYWKLCSERQYLSLHAHTHWVVLWRVWPRPHTLWPRLRPRKNFWASASLFLASDSALDSCPAGVVDITGTFTHRPRCVCTNRPPHLCTAVRCV